MKLGSIIIYILRVSIVNGPHFHLYQQISIKLVQFLVVDNYEGDQLKHFCQYFFVDN